MDSDDFRSIKIICEFTANVIALTHVYLVFIAVWYVDYIFISVSNAVVVVAQILATTECIAVNVE